MPSIYIITEAYDEHDERAGCPLAGPAGQVLRGILRQLNIDARDCVYDAVFPFRPPGGKIRGLTAPSKAEGLKGWPAIDSGKYLHPDYAHHIGELMGRIRNTKPNVIVALGNTPLWALCKTSGIKRHRGSPMLSFDREFKVIPTWAPHSVLAQWNLRPILFMDLAKAVKQSASPYLVRPSRTIYLDPSLADIEWFYQEHIVPAEEVGADIETKAGTITEIGFAPTPKTALVIPFWSRAKSDGNYWRTAAEELEAWRWVAHICREKKLVGQNFQYDMKYLWRTVGIPLGERPEDTMLMHHSLQPELEKGLGFLGSIYTDEPSWKFMRSDHSTIKKED